jgi:hypothetical protein
MLTVDFVFWEVRTTVEETTEHVRTEAEGSVAYRALNAARHYQTAARC